MLQKFLAYFLWLILFAANLNAQTNTVYKEVEDFVKTFPIKPYNIVDLKTLQREVKRRFHSEDELVRAAYVWITNNIAYDCDGYRQNKGLYELNDVITNRKSICEGYAVLMKNFCDEFGVECDVVHGFAMGISVKTIDSTNLKTNHAWNVVKVNNEWKLIDATWGSGYANDNCDAFTPMYNEYYFYCKPDEMIKDHFPEDPDRQLLAKPFTAKQFVDSIASRQKISMVSENEVEPEDSVIRKKLGETVRFYFDIKDTMNTISISTYGKEDITLFDSVRASGKGYYYDYKITQEGNYRIDLSLFYDKHQDNETYEGTPIQTYLMQVESRKKTKPPVSPKKTVKK